MKSFLKTLLYLLISVTAFYFFAKYLAPVLAPFIFAAFLTVFMEPLVLLLQDKLRLPRSLAVGISMFLVFGVTGLVVTLIITRLIIELAHLSAFLPHYIKNMKLLIFNLENQVQAYYFRLPQDVLDFIREKVNDSYNTSLDSILGKTQALTSEILNFMLRFVSLIPSWIILIIISAIATYFMSKDKKLILDYWLKVIPAPWGQKAINAMRDIFQAIMSYIRAQLILISLTFIQTLTGLYLIGAPYALLMALIIGVADLLPVLGPSSIYLLWIAWEFISGDVAFAIKLTLLYAIVLIVRQVLETKIVSTSIGLHPLATLISMFVGLKLIGPVGVVVGPLTIISLRALVSAGLITWKN